MTDPARRALALASLTSAVLLLCPATASAQETPKVDPDAPVFTPLGYVETYIQYNFNHPSNKISNDLGFDNRSETFSLANAALGGEAKWGPVSAHLLFQIGTTPSTYYRSEPNVAGASGAAPSNADVWKYVQEAYLGYVAPVGRGLLIQAGLFLSPIGPESMAVKDNWFWSQSNLFFALPFYETGVRLKYPLSDAWTLSVGAYNGWNEVVDDNGQKTIEARATYQTERVLAQALYSGGIERPTGAPEGPAWRHDLDAYGQVKLTERVSVLAHANTGWEDNRLGVANWYAGQIAARWQMTGALAVVARGDRFYENLAHRDGVDSTPIFFNGVPWVSSATATFEVKPHDHILFRLEYRHDQADGDLYFRSTVSGNGSTATPYVPNAHFQDTVTLGATAYL